jgi:hypothetical protein
MNGNENRLYIALYPSGIVNNEEQRQTPRVQFLQAQLSSIYKYHWGLFIGPMNERGAQIPGMRYHVKTHPIHNWLYGAIPLANVRSTKISSAALLLPKSKTKRNRSKSSATRLLFATTLSSVAGLVTQILSSKTAAARYLDAADMTRCIICPTK